MARSGHEFAHPDDVYAGLSATALLRTRETELAAIDEDCRGELDDTLLTVPDEHQADFIARNADLLEGS